MRMRFSKKILGVLGVLGASVVLFSFTHCKDIEQPDPLLALLLPSGGGNVGVISSDLSSSGRFSLISADGLALPGSTPVHSDAVLTYQNNRVYVVNRLNRDNIQVLQPQGLYLTELEFSVGEGTNPQDIAVIDALTAYVSLYERNELLIVNPSDGSLRGSINLGAYADGDGLAEVHRLYYQAPYLYVSVQRLDRNDASGIPAPTGISYLVEIDVRTNGIAGAYTFPGCTNPFGRMQPVTIEGSPHLIIACPGRLGFISELDGGVVAFNLAARAFRTNFLYSEVTAGGDILDVAVRDDRTGYASVLDSSFNKTIQRFDPLTGARLSDLALFPASAGFVSGLLLGPDGKLYTGNADFQNPGITIYDTNRGDVQLTATPVSVGLRPIDLVYIP